ncbi:unnamed protein product [Trichobilharzia szidati]|nr:unnamed protein product [Trichobilharzia szidati]
MLSLIQREFGVECGKIVHNTKDGKSDKSELVMEKSGFSDDLGHISLWGNPLEIEKIADFTQIIESQEQERESSRFYDFDMFVPISEKPVEGYLDNILYFIREDGEQFVALFPHSSVSKKILRISSEFNVDVDRSVDAVSREVMLSFPATCSFESFYKLPCGVFQAKFDTCEGKILSPPPSFVSGKLTVNVFPYNSTEVMSGILEDILLLKDLYAAYECDTPIWLLNSELSPDQVKVEFPKILNSVNQPDARPHTSDAILLSIRPLDTSEVIWNTLKGSPNKLTFKTCIQSIFEYLVDNRELVYLDGDNQTQLACKIRELRDCPDLHSDDSYVLYNLRIEVLIEIGLHKLTNDCIYFLECVIPGSSALREIGRKHGWNLESQWERLHYLYKSVSFYAQLIKVAKTPSVIPELRKILSQKPPRSEWRSALFESNVKPFQIVHSFSVPVRELVIPLSITSPDLWIMRIEAEKPAPTSIRIVYEMIREEAPKRYACHKLRMVQSYWPNML